MKALEINLSLGWIIIQLVFYTSQVLTFLNCEVLLFKFSSMFHHDSPEMQPLNGCWSLDQNQLFIASGLCRNIYNCMMSSFLLYFLLEHFNFFLSFSAYFLFYIHLQKGIHLIIQMPNFSYLYPAFLYDCFGLSLLLCIDMDDHLFILLSLFSHLIKINFITD